MKQKVLIQKNKESGKHIDSLPTKETITVNFYCPLKSNKQFCFSNFISLLES